MSRKKWKELFGKLSIERQIQTTLRTQINLTLIEKWKKTPIFSIKVKGCEVEINGVTEIFPNEDDAQMFVEGLQYQGIVRQFD